MPVATSIGQIYAQQINFRQSIKDKIESYIMQTELASLDPAVRRAQAALLKSQQERVNGLEAKVAELADRKDKSVGDLIDAFTRAEGQRLVAERQAQAKVISSANTAAGNAAAAANAARAKVAAANLALESDEIKAKAGANDRAWARVVAEESEGDKGVDSLLAKAAEEGRASPINTADGLSNQLERMAAVDWKAKLDRFGSNELAKNRWIENFIATAETYARSIPSQASRTAIDDQLLASGLSVSDLALEALGIDPATYKATDTTGTLRDRLVKNGYETIPNVSGYNLDEVVAVGVDLRRNLPPEPIAKKPTLKDALGLETDAQAEEFKNRTSYNYYIVDQADKQQPTITYEEFIAKPELAKTFRDKTDAASFYELAKFGDKAYIDLLLAKKGAEADFDKAQAAYAASNSKFPSYAEVARKTQEAYSAQFGGKGQQRLVALSDYGRNTLFDVDVFEDTKTGKIVLAPKTPEEKAEFDRKQATGEIRATTKSLQLDVPELEALGMDLTGGAGGGVRPTKEPKRTGAMLSAFDAGRDLGPEPAAGSATIGKKEKVVEEEVVGEEVVEKEEPIRPPLEQQGFTGRIAPRVPEGPDFPDERRELKPGEPTRLDVMAGTPKVPQTQGPDIEPPGPVDVRKPIAKTEIKAILDATDPTTFSQIMEETLLLRPGSVALLSEEELGEAGKSVSAVSKFLTSTRTPENAPLIDSKLAVLGRVARNLLVASRSNELQDADFDTKTPDEIQQAVSGGSGGGVKPAPLSAKEKRAIGDTMTFASAAKAASVAEDQRQAGKALTPEKSIPNASQITPKQKEQLRALAETPGRFSADGLNKAVARILGDKASPKVIEAAKAIYLAFEQLAGK